MSAVLSQAEHEGAGLIGTYRRIAGIGPVYEVVQTADIGKVRICLVERGETLVTGSGGYREACT